MLRATLIPKPRNNLNVYQVQINYNASTEWNITQQ